MTTIQRSYTCYNSPRGDDLAVEGAQLAILDCLQGIGLILSVLADKMLKATTDAPLA